MREKLLKLHLGCGLRKIHGFINVDIRPEVNPDYVADITEISNHFNNVDVIYASHVLEHFPFKKFDNQKTSKEVLEDWHRTLKPGGILRISVPDFGAIIDEYKSTWNLNTLKSFICGGQKHPYDIHYNIFDFQSLKSLLENVGFDNVHKYSWKETEHFYVDDYSQAYLPHMDKVHGRLMSLNIEAAKVDGNF